MSTSVLKEQPSTDYEELLHLAAVDPGLYGKTFFPKMCRQEVPNFHYSAYTALEDTVHRYAAIKSFRGSAKTSIARLVLSRRIAYGISNTIEVLGKSQDHAIYTLTWLKQQIAFNSEWTDFFRLRKRGKWTDVHLEVVNEALGLTINVIALGITGSIRGVNLADYRPDFILVDDPCDEDNTGTSEQREKTKDRFYGGVVNSLSPASESPRAKVALLQTVLHPGDLVSTCEADSSWLTLSFPCFTEEGTSAWPQRWTTAELEEMKEGYRQRNQLSLWMREMECKIVSRETSAFLPEWIRDATLPYPEGPTYISIDPTPPPSEATKRRSRDPDDCVVIVWRFVGNVVWVIDGFDCKQPDPAEFCLRLFDLVTRYRSSLVWVAIETVLFARVFASFLREKMASSRTFFALREVEDRRNKETRIRQEVGDVSFNGRLMVAPGLTKLREQFLSYPDVKHDDWLDALAIGLKELRVASAFQGNPDSAFQKIQPLNWRGNAP